MAFVRETYGVPPPEREDFCSSVFAPVLADTQSALSWLACCWRFRLCWFLNLSEAINRSMNGSYVRQNVVSVPPAYRKKARHVDPPSPIDSSDLVQGDEKDLLRQVAATRIMITSARLHRLAHKRTYVEKTEGFKT